jgi:hypothetical protein
MKKTRRRIDVNLEELDRVLDGAREAPLSESDHGKLKDTLHAMAALLIRSRNTEKTSEVLHPSDEDLSLGTPVVEKPEESESETQTDDNTPPPPGHGRNGADTFSGARKVNIRHQNLTHGERCPECGKGNVYGQKEPKVLVRIMGQAPLAATVYSLERLRCGARGQVFTAQEPEGVGPDKYDETAAAMIAQLKYGAGTPFYRLEQLEAQMGIPLPAATQWEIVEEAAQVIKPARDELIRQAAQGTVVRNTGSPRTGLCPWGGRTTPACGCSCCSATLQELEHLGVGFVSLTEALDLTTPAGRAMAGLLAVFAAFEREVLGERVRAGLAHARQNGKQLGRPATASMHADQVRRLRRSGLSKSEIARRLNIGRTSVRRILDERT